MSVSHAKVIVNPAAGGYAVRMEWPRIRKQLRRIGLSFDYEYTEGVGDAINKAKASADAGCHYLIAVGGDGTINEVANGILRSNSADDIVLGIVSAGTACSFARSLGIPQNNTSACSILTGEKRRRVDVGIVNYRNSGRSLERYFLNEADVGLGAEIVEASRDIPSDLGRSISYAPFVIAGVRSLFSYQNKDITLCVENETDVNRVCAMVVVANGSYFGGGMHIAPHAEVDDGLLDMVIVGNTEKPELVKIWRMSYDGKHIQDDKIAIRRVTNVTIKSTQKVLVEADGELLGECPATFRVMPSALTIVV